MESEVVEATAQTCPESLELHKKFYFFEMLTQLVIGNDAPHSLCDTWWIYVCVIILVCNFSIPWGHPFFKIKRIEITEPNKLHLCIKKFKNWRQCKEWVRKKNTQQTNERKNTKSIDSMCIVQNLTNRVLTKDISDDVRDDANVWKSSFSGRKGPYW